MEQNKFLNLTLSELGVLFALNLLFFSQFLQQQSEIFSYCDEVITIIFLVAAILAAATDDTHCLSKGESIAIVLFVIFIAIGFVSSSFASLGISLVAQAIDLFACVKFFLIYFSALVLFSLQTDDFCQRVKRWAIAEAKLLVVVMFLCALVNLTFDIGMSAEGERYGVRSFSFIFYHPTIVNFVVVGLVALLLGNEVKNRLYIWMALAVMLLTLRTKAFVFVAVYVLIQLMVKAGKKAGFLTILTVVLIAVLIGWDQFAAYQETGEARGELLRTSFAIANESFPLGSGFASFASNVTAQPEYYSPLYYKYGINLIYGLGFVHTHYLSDTFWPIVIAQFGYIGLVILSLSLYYLFRSAAHRQRTLNIRVLVPVLLYLLISSTSESSIFNPMAVYLGLCLALMLAGKPSGPLKNKQLEMENK